MRISDWSSDVCSSDLDVGGDVLAHAPVAAGGGLHEAAAFVADGDGQAVDLRLAHVAHVDRAVAVVEPPLQALAPSPQLVLVHGVVEADRKSTRLNSSH